MKLSELVAFRNQLDQLSAIPARDFVNKELARIEHHLHSKPELTPDLTQVVDQHISFLNQQFVNIDNTLEQIKQSVNESISREGQRLFIESYRLYDQYMTNETTDYILNRREQFPEEVKQVFVNRLKNYTDWRLPGMIVRPGLENFIESMVSNDPLYLVDTHYDLIVPAMEKFPDTYQRRLRPYVVSERTVDPILHKIPNDQFGLCLIYNFFNFRPIETIRTWLTELITKLRPGGVLIMTINDCDHQHGVILAESNYACYTPGHLILELAKSIGFEVLYTWNNRGSLTWIELRRPGELTSLKGGQTLAKIIPKPVA